MTLDTAFAWGPLETAIHDEDRLPGAPPWKDNVYIAFWDPEAEVYGCAHFSTSPNAEGRRARLSFTAEGHAVEVVEPLDRGTFTSASLDLNLSGCVRVDHPRLQGEIRFRPISAWADFSAKALPTMNDEPIQHLQISVSAEGDLTFDGRAVRHRGEGIRDRSWGYREMSVNMPEYIWYFARFDDHSITAFKFRHLDGRVISDGFILGAEAHRVVTDVGVTRDASGLSSIGHLTLEDGTELDLHSGERVAGFWLPMEWDRRAPMMSAYDEYRPLLTGDGRQGFGVIEHGQIRQLF
jgi:hypothetical protein